MSDTYQAIYDAVRSRISNGDIGYAVSEVAFRQLDISHYATIIKDEILGSISNYNRPSAIYRPTLSVDGDQWCALYGENLQEGVSGFGDSPDAAMWNFDKNWCVALKGGAS